MAKSQVQRARRRAPAPVTKLKKSLSLRTYERIKDDIITCALAPGETFTEAQLCARYRLGKAPVRWALATLAQEQLVNARPRRGYTVAPITLQAARDLFDLRLILEPAAARLAAGNVDATRLRELDSIVTAGYTPGDRASERNFLRANKGFHISIAQATGNEKITRTLAAVLEEMERLFHLGLSLRNRSDEMRHEHKALIEALVQGNKDRAERLTIEQVEAARRMVLDALLDSTRLRQVNLAPG